MFIVLTYYLLNFSFISKYCSFCIKCSIFNIIYLGRFFFYLVYNGLFISWVFFKETYLDPLYCMFVS